MRLYFMVNSGLYLCGREEALLVDGIHRGETVNFSPMPAELPVEVPKFPHRLLFTHRHPDHFDERILTLRDLVPYIYGPGFGGAPFAPIAPGVVQVSSNTAEIVALSTRHAGADFASVPHCSYCISLDGTRFFIAGDAQLDETVLAALRRLSRTSFDYVVVNPMQLLDPKGSVFLRGIEAKEVLLCHLPFADGDRLGCYSLAKTARKRYPPDLPPLRQLIPMSWVPLGTGGGALRTHSQSSEYLR